MHKTPHKKVCIVTDELAGPDYNGGIGTACQGLASVLADAGYAVDVLYTRVAEGSVQCAVGSFPDHVESYLHRGIRLRTIAHSGPWHDYAAKSFAAMNHLQGESYDLVFFNDTHGTGFYPVLSRRTGNPRLAATRMCVVTHSATQWIVDLNGEPIQRAETLRLFEMERRSIELSDVVFSPSAYLIAKYKEYGWKFPPETQVRRNNMPRTGQAGRTATTRRHPVDELVFFGRLERRKGIDLFCAALDRLKFVLQGKKVTFLGKDTVVNGVSSLEEVVKRSAAWPFEIQVMPSFNREGALNYLQSGRRVAVMPSFEENSPCAIQECLQLGIAFIASSGSGGEELIAPASRADCCFVPTVRGLSEKIAQVLQTGAPTGQLSFDPEENERSLLDWVSRYLSPASNSTSTFAHGSRARALPSLTTILMAPDSADRSSAARYSKEVAAAFLDPIDTAVISASTAEASRSAGRHLTPDSYDDFADSIVESNDDYVCIWDAGLELNAGWLLRAKNLLESDAECVAVTGLASKGAPEPLERPPAYMSLLSLSPALRQPIVGATEPVALLSQESNNGFVLLRAAAFREVRDCSPWDGIYACAKAADEWVDELLQRLRRRGAKIALIPDLPALPRRPRSYFEVFRAGAARRSALATSANNGPGSPRGLIYGLGIDKLADAEANQSAVSFLQVMAKQTKVQPHEWASSGGLSNAHLEKVAIAAFSTGQLTLSKEILAYLASLKGASSVNASAEVERFWESRSDRLCLARLLEQSACHRSDEAIRPSIAIDTEDAALLFPVSRFESGRGQVSFELDLTDFSSFSAHLRAVGPEGLQLWFYAGLSSTSSGRRVGMESLATVGSGTRLDFSLPQDLQGPCTFNLVVERRSQPAASNEATGIWENPHFTRARPGQDGRRQTA
jgi:glycosyltransferase involved in cell wall biosynthesis